MKCYIFCSARDCDIDFLKSLDFSDSFVICADGGFDTVSQLGLKADLWVGDMDSYKGENIGNNSKKIVFPTDKDLTDSHIAVKEALKRNLNEIYIIGATGGRLDHEYANYCLLKFVLKNGGFATIINKNNRVFMTDKSMKIYPDGKKYISFFPFGGEISDLSVKNLKYTLDKYHLTDDLTYTVSNEFLGELAAEVEFSSGYLLVICSNDIR